MSMNLFKALIEGEEVTLQYWGNSTPRFQTALLPDKVFDSEEKIEAAIKAYKLSLRKKFVNGEAYKIGGVSWRSRMHDSKDKVTKVTVTSVTPTGDEAWISDGKERAKVKLQELYPEPEAVSALIKQDEANEKASKAAWKALPRWAPKSK